MKPLQRKNCIAGALWLVGVSSAVADPIVSWDLGDFDSDGLISDFAFFSVPPGDGPNKFGPTGETGCINATDGNNCDPIAFGVGPIGTDVFSTGFNFGGTGIFAPNVTGNMEGQIEVIDGAGTLGISFTALDFGGVFGGVQFFLGPDDINAVAVDPSFPLASNGDGTVDAVIRWVGTIDDPTSPFDGFASNWRLEGTVTVADGPPVIFIAGNPAGDVPGDTTVNADPDTTYVDQGAACHDVVDGEITGPAFTTTINNPNAPSTGPAGSVFTVEYECTDSQGNITLATRTVQVGEDTEPPVITLGVGQPEPGRSDAPDGSAVDILVGNTYVDAGATCSDNRDGTVTIPPGGGSNPPLFVTPDPPLVDTSTPATGIPITFSCDDTSNNGPTVEVRTVDVLADDVPPVISLLGANPVTVAVGTTYIDSGAVCEDTNPIDTDPVDISANIVTNPADPSSIDTSSPATFTITYDCMDAAGNPATQQSRVVNVASGQNFRIESMSITDLDGDGIAGCFKFDSLDPVTCSLANRFSSDGSVTGFADPSNATLSGTGTDLDENGNPVGITFWDGDPATREEAFQPITEFKAPEFGSTPQPVGPISPGFMFSGFPFVPTTVDPPLEDADPPSGFVTVSGNTAIITIESLPFSGLYNSNTPNLFFLNPDPGTLQSTITQVNDDDNGTTRTFDYAMTWSHIITPAEDPTGAFVNFKAFWRLEGVITADSVPIVINNPPEISGLRVVQDGRDPTTIVVASGGTVTATVAASDPDGDGLLYDWSQNSVVPVGPTNQPSFAFDPGTIEDGPLALTVLVTDDSAEPLSVEGQVVLNVLAQPPELSDEVDSDGDGVSDAAEGFGDDDDDGIANYQDPIDGNTDPGRNRIDFRDPAGGDIVSSAGRLRLGQVTTATGEGDFIATEADIAAYAGPGVTPVNNAQDRLNRVDGLGPIPNGIRDFVVDGLPVGSSVQVVIPQDQPLPVLPVYRKYTADNGWVPFSTVAGNALGSAATVNGVCPAPGDPAYNTPVDDNGNSFMVEGDECVQLTIVDGGGNDGDFTRNGIVVDPGTVSSNGPKADAQSLSSPVSGGCSVNGEAASKAERVDWTLLLVALFALYGVVRHQRSRRGSTRRPKIVFKFKRLLEEDR
jgi:hypothetical protein